MSRFRARTRVPATPQPGAAAVGAPSVDSAAGADADGAAGAATRLESTMLREELTHIGLELGLPSKRPNRPTLPVQYAVRPQQQHPRRFRQWVAGAVVFVGAGIGVASLRRPPTPTLPTALLGNWITTNPAYIGRQLSFGEAHVVMRVTADAPSTRHPIVAMSSRTIADTTVLGLTYNTEDGPLELHARLVAGIHPRLQFDRPTGLVWERRED